MNILKNDTEIRNELSKLKEGSNDFNTRWNSGVIQRILDIIETKMFLLEQLMSISGMKIGMIPNKRDIPAALGGDDFVG